jgi:hypothetical protein
MATEAHGPTASEYIVHHLQHLQNVKQKSIIDFSVYNLDSIVVAAILGCGLFRHVVGRSQGNLWRTRTFPSRCRNDV